MNSSCTRHQELFDLKDIPLEADRTLKRLIISGVHAEMAVVEREPGAEGGHNHPNEQFVYCLEGKAEFKVGDETHTLEDGQLLHVPPNVFHGINSLIRVRVLTVYAPGRDASREAAEKGEKERMIAG